MNFRAGEDIVVGGVIRWDNNYCDIENINDYDIKVRVIDECGNNKFLFGTDSVVVDDRDNSICCLISSELTSKMRGLYFIVIELWWEGSNVYSNEVETIYVYP